MMNEIGWYTNLATLGSALHDKSKHTIAGPVKTITTFNLSIPTRIDKLVQYITSRSQQIQNQIRNVHTQID